MTHPIMRFKDDFGRYGIAFQLEGYADGVYGPLRDMPIRNISGVLSVFQRFPKCNSWLVGTSGFLIAMYAVHVERDLNGEGLRCGDQTNYSALFDFLAGQNPLFRIAQGYVPPLTLPPQPHTS